MTTSGNPGKIYCKVCRQWVPLKDFGTVYCLSCEFDIEDDLDDHTSVHVI